MLQAGCRCGKHSDCNYLVRLLWHGQFGHLLFGLLAMLCQQLFALGGSLHLGALQYTGWVSDDLPYVRVESINHAAHALAIKMANPFWAVINVLLPQLRQDSSAKASALRIVSTWSGTFCLSFLCPMPCCRCPSNGVLLVAQSPPAATWLSLPSTNCRTRR